MFKTINGGKMTKKEMILRNDENNTTALEMKKMCNKLITASMKTKTNVNIEFWSRSKELNKPNVDLTFYKDNDNFSITLYSFYSIKKNTRMINLALELMKNDTKFEEIKNKIKDEIFRNV